MATKALGWLGGEIDGGEERTASTISLEYRWIGDLRKAASEEKERCKSSCEGARSGEMSPLLWGRTLTKGTLPVVADSFMGSSGRSLPYKLLGDSTEPGGLLDDVTTLGMWGCIAKVS